ncbi:MAG: pantetheine-phosphate adenylyltransferase [Bacteroidetes bacterium]|nr:pantetheine-phosphate adenylyltransferase [Bacteroidota bacterium]
MKNIAVFPGSFDPVTRGHESIIRRALLLFDKIIIAVGDNPEKRAYFPFEKRMHWLDQLFGKEKKIEVRKYSGLTVDFCKAVNANFILRGLRTSADFEFERTIGQVNKVLDNRIETIFLLTVPEYTALSSSVVREIIINGGDPGKFVPDCIDLGGKK